MSEIKKENRCLECGGDLKRDPRTGILTCVYCRRQHKNTAEEFSEELQEIVKQRQLREFIKAEELCAEFLKKEPQNCEAHWQMLLATLGVVYVQEGDKMKPTFFSCSYSERESILDDKNYRLALQYSPDEESRSYYEVRARELDGLLKEFFMLVKKEENYDIFISFKQTIEAVTSSGDKRTFESDDCRKAREIYEHLKDRYRVFFSPVSIGKDTGIQGEKYEPRILKALQTSQAMILVGFSEANLKAQWVENEWRRYKYQIDKGAKKKNSLIYVYEKQMHLPTALKDIQWPNVDVYEGKYLEKLDKMLTFVDSKKGLKSLIAGRKLNVDFEDSSESLGYSTTARAVISVDAAAGKAQIKIDATEDRDLLNGAGMLGHRKWGDAEKLFKMILRRNPQSAAAYWGIFKARIKAENDQSVAINVLNAKASDFEFVDKAIENAPNAEFSWSIIDKFIDGCKSTFEWQKIKPIYEFLIKYVDESRIKKLHTVFKDLCIALVKQGETKKSEEVFENAKKIFIEEVRENSITLIATYAKALHEHGYYAIARKYFEQLAGIRNTAAVYTDLLACRLKTQAITQTSIKLAVNPDDDSSKKKPSELDIDEILERILICDNRERTIAKNKESFKIVLPVYRIKVVDADNNVTSLSKEIHNQAGVTIATAKQWISQYKLTDVYDWEEDAIQIAETLSDKGVDCFVAEDKNRPAATQAQIVAAVGRGLKVDPAAAKKYVAENDLYKREYDSKDDAEEVIASLADIDVNAMVVSTAPDTVKVSPLSSETYKTTRQMVLYQVHNNPKHVHVLMETLVSCYRQLGDKELLIDLMRAVADEFVTVRDFKQAGIWYRELLIEDTNDAAAHWGTLKCRLKASDDYAVQRHSKKLMDCQEFNNAINCADNTQYKYYMSVYYKELPAQPKDAKKSSVAYASTESTGDTIKWGIKTLLICAVYAAFVALVVILFKTPELIFKHIHFGWVIAIYSICAIALFVFGVSHMNGRWAARTKYIRQANSKKGDSVFNERLRIGSHAITVSVVLSILFAIALFTAGPRTYSLSEAQDFMLMKNLPGAHRAIYLLENDIDFKGEGCDAFGAIDKFEGVFDGQGHTIKNLRVEGEIKGDSEDAYKCSFGLVKTLTEKGVIKNLNMKSCSVRVGTPSGSPVFVGTLAGLNGGVIRSCNLTDCYVILRAPSYAGSSYSYAGGVAGAYAKYVFEGFKNSYYSDKDDLYGKGYIADCTFHTVNDADDLADDDNYRYAIVCGNINICYDGISYLTSSDNSSGLYHSNWSQTYETLHNSKNFSMDLFGGGELE